ncbi:hypothetical protein BRETT_003946 [Brettanomyces bruxellensis]|uniref:MICOS complex subunit MIC19 n=1 Tax=Dekkera bruxellensis TaxID=5007 RepID=A0A871R9M1_DEKBR|nr:uncharacterized protein BRETT_003946 [Brettanomyces bruxellensis]QOU19792.1 hypothetical protein BRETT_003946 [Brettanomyces bruxellensis]
MSQEQKVKTFYPKTPVEFSATLLSELDNSNESNYTRQQYAKQLAELEKDERAQLGDALEKSLFTGGDDKTASTASVNKKLKTVSAKLHALNNFEKAKSDELKQAENEVVKCFNGNRSKPLSCWNEVQKFKQAASSL